MKQVQEFVFSETQLKDWAKEVCQAVGMTVEEAQDVADVLVMANLRGTDTHGINLVRAYADRFRRIDVRPIKFSKDFGAIAQLDGGNHTGPHVGITAMKEAMKRADSMGIGLVVAANSSHFGAAAYYAQLAAEADYIGFVASTAFPTIAPWGGLKTIIGNNPFAVAVPGDDYPIVLDMACSVTARNKIFQYQREGLTLPEGWALDKHGEPTTDADAAAEGLLMPVGGYKGVGLAVMVDLLLALLNGGTFSDAIMPNANPENPQNVSHLFMAIQPSAFYTPEERGSVIASFIEKFKSVPKKEAVTEVYLPGELEWQRAQKRQKDGILLTENLLKELNDFAAKIDVAPLKGKES